MATNDGIIKRFQKMFNIGVDIGTNENIGKKLYALKKDVNSKEGLTFNKEEFSPQVKQLWNYWLNSCHDSAIDYEDRKKLFEDMDMLYYNSPLNARAMKLIADEVIQADSNQQFIMVEAKEKVRKFILNFFDQVNIYSLIKPLTLDIIQYGNAGWILSLNDKGVEQIIPVDVYQIKDRLEFTPFEVEKKMKSREKFFMQYSAIERVKQLIDSITNKDNYASYFKSYLFGFQIGEYVLPPWRFLHFRNATNKSPFKPFGIPLYIHSLAPYRQYDFAMTLQVLARGAKFPIDKYNLNLPSVVNPTDKIQKAIEFLNQLLNSGIGSVKKEESGVGEMIITITDLFDFEQIVPDIDLGKVDDLEMLRDDLIVATELPRNIIDPNDSSFGDSGVSLIQKWKPFARLVYGVQQIILENLTQLVKIHMIQSNQFTTDEMDFQLSMPYPEGQVDSEIIDSQENLLGLANDIIDALSDKILDGESLPDDILKDIYTQFLPYDQDRIDKWFKSIIKHKADSEKEMAIEENWRKVENNIGRKKLKEVVSNIIFEKKQEYLREGSLGNKHYYSSKNKLLDFDINLLSSFKKEKLNEANKENKEVSIKEEIKYVFKSDSNSNVEGG